VLLAEAATLADDVDRGVAHLEPPLHVLDRGLARAVLPVREEHEGPPSPLLVEEGERAQDHVVERGAPPRREAVHGAGPRDGVGLAPGEREDVVVEREEGELVLLLERLQEPLYRLAAEG